MKREFTRDEVEELVMDSVEDIEGSDRRWSRTNTSIVEVADKFYKLYWEQGLTENQENEYESQEAPEVRLVEEKITTIKRTWVKV